MSYESRVNKELLIREWVIGTTWWKHHEQVQTHNWVYEPERGGNWNESRLVLRLGISGETNIN